MIFHRPFVIVARFACGPHAMMRIEMQSRFVTRRFGAQRRDSI
jgi:hypothetical protein